MNDAEKQKLWLTLGSIEEHCANTKRYIEEDREWKKEIADEVEAIKLERAEEKGAAKAAGRNAGLLGGGIISVVIAGIRAAFTGN